MNMARNNPDISVIIPSHNHGEFLEQCLVSLLKQRGPTFEIIVVDDGSSDDTESRIKPFLSDISYVYQRNQGVSVARNNGLKNARGTYIQFLDADDFLPENCLANKYASVAKHPEKTISVCRNRIFTSDPNTGKIKTGPRWGLPTDALELHLCRLNIAPPHSYFLPRQLIDDIGFFEESYTGCEDYDYWLRAMGAGYRFQYVRDTEVFYRHNTTGKARIKMKLGELPFDVLVHRKKREGAYGQGVDRAIASSAGRLALADGMLRTALDINPTANKLGRDQLATWAAECIGTYLSSSPDPLSTLEHRLFLRRVLQKRLVIQKLQNDYLHRAFDELIRHCGSWKHLIGDVRAMYPFNTYEKQLLIYSTFWPLSQK